MFIRVATAAVVALVLFGGGMTPARAVEDTVVAVVNGQKITLGDVKSAYAGLPDQYKQVPFETIFPGLVDSLIDLRLTAADARRRKIHEGEEFAARMARIEDQILQRMALSQAIESGVTDAAVRERFEQVVREMGESEQIHARHILVETKEAAEKVIVDLKKGGDFAALARERSTGPSGAEGGDLGFFSKGQMVPDFEKAAFALKKGAYTQSPVKTQFGWHVIMIEDRKAAEVPTFEDMETTIRNSLSQEAGTRYIMGLREGAEISRFNADGSPRAAEKPAPTK